MQETHTNAKDEKINISGFSGFFHHQPRRSRFGRNIGGLATFVSEELTNLVEEPAQVGSESVLWLIFQTQAHGTVCLANIYNQPLSSPNRDPNFFTSLRYDIDRLNEIYNDPSFILVGDFNARTGSLAEFDEDEWEDETVPGGVFIPRRSCDETVNDPGRALLSLCHDNEFYMLNGRSGSSSGDFTFSAEIGKSVVDYFILSDNLFNNNNPTLFVVPSDLVPHSALVVPLSAFTGGHVPATMAAVENTRRKNVLPPVIEIKSREDALILADRFHDRFDLFLPYALQQIQQTNFDEAYSSFMQFLTTVGLPFIKRKKHGRLNQLDKGTTWFDHTCRRAKQQVRRASEQYKQSRSESRRLLLAAARRAYRRTLKSARKLHSEKLQSRVAAAVDEGDLKLVWKTIKSMKRDSVDLSSVVPEQWTNHFSDIMNHESPSREEWNINPSDLPNVPVLDAPITDEEVFNAVSSLKSGKSPGWDGIKGSVLKALCDLMLPFLTPLFNGVFEHGHFPKSWNRALICPIYKGAGSKSSPGSYRGIALLSQVGKIFSRILARRLSEWVESDNLLDQCQGGFRKKRRTADNILILDTLLREELNKKRGKLYISLLDKRRAFDYIPRDAVMYRLAKIGVSKKIFCVLKSMFSTSTFGVKLSPTECTDFERSSSGIFQGCVISPLLFIITLDALNDALKDIESDSPEMNGRIIKCLLWADDAILISKSIDGLQKLLNGYENFCAYMGIEINLNKTKTMVFKKGARLSREEKWFLNGRQLEVVRSHKVLGVTFHYNGSWAAQHNNAVSKSQLALFTLLKFYFKNKDLPGHLFLKLFEVLVESVLLYGSEVWGVYPTSRQAVSPFTSNRLLDKPAVRFLKNFLGVPKSASNSGVLIEMSWQRASAKAMVKAINYWLHLNSAQPGQIMFDCLEHQRSMIARGQPAWLSHIENILNFSGFGELFLAPPLNDQLFKVKFKERVIDIALSDLLEEACSMSSLSHYSHLRGTKDLPNLTKMSPSKRRTLSVVRLNLKYALPVDDLSGCKFCRKLVLNRWKHFLYECEKLPRLDPSWNYVPYPECISRVLDCRWQDDTSPLHRLYLALSGKSRSLLL